MAVSKGLPVQANDVGRFAILTDVHGYLMGDHVMVPLRGIAEWVGAAVTWQDQNIRIMLSGELVQMRLGSKAATTKEGIFLMPQAPFERDGITCVPLRSVAGLLGVKVRYIDSDEDEGDIYSDPTAVPGPCAQVAGIPSVLLTSGGQQARVLVHYEPPSVVARVVTDLESTEQWERGDPDPVRFALGRFGHDWLLQVTEIVAGHFYSFFPATIDPGLYWTGHEIFWSDAWAVYGVREGRWCFVQGGNGDPSREEWTKAGIPENLAGLFALELRD
ncbi:MAG: copper amine oxidase N-terminal domain-containing protein [Armatimonadetes bacterium]|nr:copper amine oxidase N-terminal domain-containing protein [Armatimonadota bacterium]